MWQKENFSNIKTTSTQDRNNNMNTIINSINTPSIKKEHKDMILAGTVGTAAGAGVKLLSGNKMILATMDAFAHKNTVSASEGIALTEGFNKVMAKEEIKKLGYKNINPLTDEGKQALSAVYKESVDAKAKIIDKALLPKFVKTYLKNKNERVNNSQLQMFLRGENACSIGGKYKLLVVPSEGKNLMGAFHEVGHAIPGKLSNLVLTRHMAPKLAIPLIALSAFTPDKKQKDPNTPVQNLLTSIRNNAGKLTMLLFVPKLIEEARASINGAKLAKGVLDKNLFKKVRFLQNTAFLTYLASAAAAGIGARAAVYISDAIQAKRPQKANKCNNYC